jgi:LAO/AO transport system kinase
VTAELVQGLLAGDVGSLARAITVVENELAGWQALLAGVQHQLGRAAIVGFTGPPGVGKSTLVNTFIKEQRRRGRTVGVIAVDPSSPLTGGAVLGDRVRMTDATLDPGVFIRSVASRGRLGGLSAATARIVDVMDASGREVVVLETVGAGQSEVEVASLAETTVVVCAPGWGDDIQAIKAGILEIADVLVVNKSDDPRSGETAQQLSAMLMLRRGPRADIPVVNTIATTGDGVATLADAIDRHAQLRGTARNRTERHLARVQHLIVEGALASVRARWIANPELIATLAQAVERSHMDLEAASGRLVRSLCEQEK